MTMRSCKGHRSARTALATFAAAVLALSTLAPQSLAYAVEAAQNMAAGGGRALVVVEEGFDVTSFSQAGLTWEALVEAGGSDVSVADIQADAESDIAEAAVQGDAQAQDLLGSPEGVEAVSTFDLAASVADEARDAGTPAQTGASYRQSASLSGIYLVTCPTLDAAQVVQRASALEGVLFAEADQIVAEGSSDVEDGAAALEEGEASATAEKDETADGDAAIEDDEAVQEDAAADGTVSGDPAADDSPAAAEESADAAVSTEEGDAAAAVAEDAAGAEGEDPIEEKAEPLAESATSERVASADLTDLEWYLGSSGGMRDAADPVDLNIPAQFVEQAAAVDDPPVIAVVDTGVDYTNPALAPSMVDLSQYPGLMEDTGCGKFGIDATAAAGDPAFANPMDLNQHGTHVAGIIAANGDVKGVNPHARIVGVRVTLPDPGSTTGESVYTSGIVRGLGWMVEAKRDYGVNIEGFNLSIAGPTGVTYAARAAFKLAEENGIVGFVAAGNFAANVDESENLLSAVQQGSTVVVDSADTTGDTSWFSNYGKINTDVFSPGSSILATLPNDLSVYHPAIAKRYGEALVYEGFETAGSAGDAYDGDVGGGLTFCYFDEQAEDGCGEEIAATGERFFVGESSLLVVADEYYEGQQQFDYERRAAIVSEPIDLTATPGWAQRPDEEPLRFALSSYCDSYLGYGGMPTASYQVTVSFKLDDGSWSQQAQPWQGGPSADWLEFPSGDVCIVPENADLKSFQVKIEFAIIAFDPLYLPDEATLHVDTVGVGYGTHPYGFLSGTSMATPATAGAFALLRAVHSDESPLRTSARIVGGATDDARLADLCSTGGRVDVAHADADPDPVLVAVSCGDGELVLDGWFLGDGGQVTVGGVPAQVVSWTADTLVEPGTVVVKVPDGIAGSHNVVLTRGDGATAWTSALIAERMTDFTELPLPDFAEYEVAESGSLAYWDGDVYLETVSIPEDSYLLDYYRYDTAARTWEHVGTIDTGSKDAGAASGLAVAGDQLYRFRNDGPRLVDNVGPTMALYRFDRDADAFDPDPVELSMPVGAAHAVATWGDRLIVIADDAKGERFDLLVLAIDPASGTVEELGALPTEAIGIHSASVSKRVLYVHVPGDALDASDVDRLCVCPLDDIESARLIDLPATDSDTPYSAQVAASNGDAALLGLPGILDSGEATNSDVWKVVEGAQEASPTHVVLQAGGSTELASVIAGDMLYVWGVSRAIDERTFFRCLPLSALGMEAEGTASEEDVPPASVDEEPLPLPGDPSAMASTGDGAGYPLAVAAILALVSAGAAGTAFRRTRTSSSDRWPRSRER